MDQKVGSDRSVKMGHYIELFEATVARSPEALAVRDAARQVSYAELDAMSRRLAGRLQSSGVRPRDIVAISREHGVATLAAILAVFRCGAAYLPIDPELPVERQRRMLDIGECRVVLAGGAVGDAINEAAGTRTVLDVEAVLHEEPMHPCSPVAGDMDDPAYVIFTSGSTGQPKGAVLSQRNLVNHLKSKIDVLGLDHTDVVAVTAPIGFDLSVWQYLVAGLVGASVAAIPRSVVRESLELMDTLAAHAVTVFEAVPSHFGLLLDVAMRHVRSLCPTIRAMVTAGEALPAALARQWFDQGGGMLVNAYGPTECGVDVTHHVMHEAPAGDDVPIGTAIDGALLVVVDEHFRPVPEGMSGELLIGGVALGKGYLRDPERTAMAFIEPEGLGNRFYRSGDQVRQRGGIFEFLGRIDLQIKLRGHRIEPGEIEATLLGDPRVRSAAVVLHEDDAGAELAAVVQPVDPRSSTEELREALRARMAASLPDYMCPPVVEFVHTMPTNLRGKIDREAVNRFLAMLNPFR